MSGIVCRSVAAALGFVLAVTLALAHHSISAKFDPDRPLRLSGLVTNVDWANPHVHVFIDVEDGDEVTSWAIELESRVDLEQSGWAPESLTPGDALTVEGIAARDGSEQAWGNSIVMTDTGARIFEVSDAGRGSTSTLPGPTPRWPDGQPRLGPPPGGTGYWGSPSATALVEIGADVEMDVSGILADIGDASDVAPLQRWALALYEMRQRDLLRFDPMFLRCIPPGGPRQFQLPYGIQFVEERERERIFVLIGSGNRNWRFIYTDGREQVGQVGGDDDNPLYYGRSVGEWEGDTFVVDTTGFNEAFWFTNGGLPHTDQLHLIERFRRPDLNTLNYEVTIEDPGAYTRTWTSGWTMQWIEGEELPIYFCQDNRP